MHLCLQVIRCPSSLLRIPDSLSDRLLRMWNIFLIEIENFLQDHPGRTETQRYFFRTDMFRCDKIFQRLPDPTGLFPDCPTIKKRHEIVVRTAEPPVIVDGDRCNGIIRPSDLAPVQGLCKQKGMPRPKPRRYQMGSVELLQCDSGTVRISIGERRDFFEFQTPGNVPAAGCEEQQANEQNECKESFHTTNLRLFFTKPKNYDQILYQPHQ